MATQQPSEDVRGMQVYVSNPAIALAANNAWNGNDASAANADTEGLLMKAYRLSMVAC